MRLSHSLGICPVLYLLDANVLIDANRDYYPIDRVPEFWDWLIAMGKRGRVKVPLDVYEEITDGNDAVAIWLKDNRDALLLDEDVREELVMRATEEGYANDLSDSEIEKVGRDPFLIAYALAGIGVVWYPTSKQNQGQSSCARCVQRLWYPLPQHVRAHTRTGLPYRMERSLTSCRTVRRLRLRLTLDRLLRGGRGKGK